MTDPTTSILDAYDTLFADAIQHTPGGVLLPSETQALRRRVARGLGVSAESVADALTRRDHAARLAQGVADA
jgi:hypothetical protein